MVVVERYAKPENGEESLGANVGLPVAMDDSRVAHTRFPHEETAEMGSYNHAMTQTNIGFLLKQIGTYSVFTELSLDTSRAELQNMPTRDEMKPDVCLYPKRRLSRPFDILKMAEMPLLAVEILSPKQGIQEILEKFAVYFALGVQSCWLVDPITAIVAVYSSLDERAIFSAGEVVDQQLNIRLPFTEIFE